MSALRVRVENLGSGVTLMFPDGDIDSHTCYTLKEALEKAHRAEPKSIVIDMGGVSRLSSAGLDVLLEAMKKLEERQAELVLSNLRSTSSRVSEMVKALPANRLFPDVETARRNAVEML